VGADFKEFDHSGDIGIEAWGVSLDELLRNATLGLLSLLHWNPVEPRVERRLRVSSPTAEDLLVDWLGEVISMAGAYGELYSEVDVVRSGEWHAEGILRGERVDPEKHALRFEVKAATYHGLTVEKKGEHYHSRVIFDL
jgi:SHS2 domain-containing protein